MSGCEEDSSKHQNHIVMLPFMAHGHLIPFLALAKQILLRVTTTTPSTSISSSNSNHQQLLTIITIAATPQNISYLRKAIASDPCLSDYYYSSSSAGGRLRLAPLPFDSSTHGLPPDTENTETVPLDKIIALFHASASLEAPVLDLVSDITARNGDRPPLCIISDLFFGWANGVAARSRTVNVAFSTGGAYGTAAYVSIWDKLPHTSSPVDEFHVYGFPDSYRFHLTQLHHYIRNADGTDDWSRFFQTQIRLSLGSFGMLCNTAEGIEPVGLEALKECTKLPIWTIGPLLPSLLLLNSRSSESLGRHSGRETGVPLEQCLQWLDIHHPEEDSVLYISFGSQNSVTPPQMMELASGLEKSEKPFIWVIRPPFGFHPRGEFKSEWLPVGFKERVHESKQGLLVPGWAPQLEILRHRSTGAFLSHCGWNSTIESLSQGVPIIGWPLAAEQAYNSKMLTEEMGVCVEIARGLQGSVDSEGVKSVVDLVMENKKGKGEEMKRKAVEIGEIMREAMLGKEGSSLKALDHFFTSLLSAAAT